MSCLYYRTVAIEHLPGLSEYLERKQDWLALGADVPREPHMPSLRNIP